MIGVALNEARERHAPVAPFKRTMSDDPAPAIDQRLVCFSNGEARSRLNLGRAASRFLLLRGHQSLGFARVGDYARERLGISGRELESVAFVASRLAVLPRIARAFARGEVSWSQVRVLCSVANIASEADWLERARALTVRELVEEIRRSRVVGGSGADALDDEGDAIEGEERLRFAIACPARIALLWRRAVELGRRMLGSQAPLWQVAEAIAAEEGAAAEASAEIEVEIRARSEVPVALPARPRGLVSDSSPSPDPCPDSDPEPLDSMDAFELDRVMRDLVGAIQELDSGMGVELRRVVDLRLYRSLGFESFDVYVRERLGISPAKARALVAVERKAKGTAELGPAYRSGELSWVRVLAILPVVDDSRAERTWVNRAREVTVRRLQDEVEWALDMRDAEKRPALPPELGARLERPDLQMCARFEGEGADRRVTFYGPASVIGMFCAGVRGLARSDEPVWKGFERLLLLAITQWESEPRHRDPVFARDGWRCSVPGCTSRRNLQDHHVEFRSQGGGNEPSNRIAICAAHHLHGIHRGVVRARGHAPDDILWELGLRPGAVPLLRLDGERYLSVFEN